VASALLLPPVPLLVLILVGARLMFRRRLLAWLLILLGVAGIWLSCTSAVGNTLVHWLTQPPPVLTESAIAEIKRSPRTAIVVLGGGRKLLAPEYGISTLHERSIERLRYGIWLSKETGLPLAFSGGVGHGAPPGPTEAEIATRVAEREFGRPLRWAEAESRDTRENATKTVALLRAQGIEHIVLVTHDYHMRRAMRNFQRAAEGSKISLLAAPMGLPRSKQLRATDWMPSNLYMEKTSLALHEWLGYLFGA
jgi:uncharacterized SAM-binding protein YcdF (DUF218 family)